MLNEKLTEVYTYFSSMPTIGRDQEKSEIINYNESLLTDTAREGFIGWRWFDWHKDRYIHILIDMCGETYIDHIKLRFVFNFDKCDYQEFLLSARTNQDERYSVVSRHLKDDEKPEMLNGDEFIVDMPVKKTVRCLNLQMLRGEWWNLPVPQIEIFGEDKYERSSPYTRETMAQECQREPMYVDEYGQASYIDYPNKIKSDEDFKRDAVKEAHLLKDVQIDTEKYDLYGGMKTGKTYEATGYFRVQKIDGVWWFITPDGNPYFLKGIDGIAYDEMSHYTPLYKNGTNEIRGVFEKLPDREKFANAYKIHVSEGRKGVPVIDFQEANLIRKYGSEYRTKWADITHKRLLNWGFNGSGKWKFEPEIKLPYVAILGWPEDAVRTLCGIDPFDSELEEKLGNTFKDTLTQNKDNPMIIGYHFGNEDGWEMGDLSNILHNVNDEFPAKRAFVEFIKDRYNNDLRVVNIILQTNATCFEELAKTDIDMSKIPSKDASLFVQMASRELHSKLKRAFKKYDENHLFFGATPVPTWRSCYDWNIAYADYVDVLVFDWYFSSGAEWMKDFLYLDKPIMNLEFGYAACERGHAPFFHSICCSDEADRAKRYTRYVKNQAKCPQFIGIGYFIYSDQEISGRSNGDGTFGEAYQFGLVSSQDQPYEEFAAAVRETNAEIEELHMHGADQE